MKKRFPKIRKKTKNTPVTSEKRKNSGRKGKAARGGALVPYERGEIESAARKINDIDATVEETADGKLAEAPRKTDCKTGGDVFRAVCVFIVIFSLLGGVALTCFAFAVLIKYGDDGDRVTSETEVTDTESGKVIFIHSDGVGEGLTAPEIYERCADTAVSLSVELSDGGEGIGSGFIITDDGYIATAAHVINNAQNVEVILSDGKGYKAEIIGADSLSDVALLKINTDHKLPFVQLGDSESLVTGERVYAIGTPAGLSYSGSLTSGEISCAQRILPVYREEGSVLEKKIRVIQINAEVNKGNSGCPLFDSYGRVIGMITMRLGDGFSGIGFALPAKGIEPILRSMMEGRAVDAQVIAGVVELPARLGVECYTDREEGVYGCRVSSVGEGASAYGVLKSGDLIIQIDNRLVTAPSDISAVVEQKSAGDRVRVSIIRSGQRLAFDITLGN